jgi:hypothetical protein
LVVVGATEESTPVLGPETPEVGTDKGTLVFVGKRAVVRSERTLPSGSPKRSLVAAGLEAVLVVTTPPGPKVMALSVEDGAEDCVVAEEGFDEVAVRGATRLVSNDPRGSLGVSVELELGSEVDVDGMIVV